MDNSVRLAPNSSNYHLAQAFHNKKHIFVNQMLLLESKCVYLEYFTDQSKTTERENESVNKRYKGKGALKAHPEWKREDSGKHSI